MLSSVPCELEDPLRVLVIQRRFDRPDTKKVPLPQVDVGVDTRSGFEMGSFKTTSRHLFHQDDFQICLLTMGPKVPMTGIAGRAKDIC
jgi:hypothetical protein